MYGLNPQERKKAYEQLVLNEFKRHTAAELGVDEESLRFIPVRNDSETSLRLKEIGGVFGQDVVIFKDGSSVFDRASAGASGPRPLNMWCSWREARWEKNLISSFSGMELLHRMQERRPGYIQKVPKISAG